MEHERQVLGIALAVMVALIVIVTGAMWLGAELSGARCAARTATQAATIADYQQQLRTVEHERDSLRTTLRVLICVKPGAPPLVRQC